MLSGEVKSSVSNQTLWRQIVIRKLSAPVVIVFLVLISFAVSAFIAREGYVAGLIIIFTLISIPIFYASVVYPTFGIITLVVLAFVINFISRFLPEPTPIGVVMDGLTYLLILGFFIRQKRERDWSYFNNPITYFTLIWIAYNILEIINPNSPSILEWVFTVRLAGIIMLMYFVFLFHLRTKEQIRLILKIWLALEIFSALYGFSQEHIGLLKWDFDWVHRYPDRYKLLFIGGHLRKWGPFSDPVVYAYNMVAAALFCISLALVSNISSKKKIYLFCLTAFFFLVTLYSGTRASYVIIPAAMGMLTILNFNKKVFAFVVAGGFILCVLIVMPTKNPTLARFQSAFKPSKDASFKERARNQELIKPYILAHPIGGGLGSVGIWGERFAPNSFLAKFPPDSGYVRVAVEMGWIGLLIYCIFNFVILYTGIRYFYLVRDPELKAYCLAMVLIIFAFDIGNYPQQAIVQYPSNILFYLAMALLNVAMRIDIAQRKLKPYKTVA